MSEQEVHAADKYDKYRLIAENVYNIIAIIDPVNWEYKYISPSHARTFDYHHEKQLGQNGLELVHAADRERFKKILNTGVNEGKGNAGYRWRNKEGVYIWLEIAGEVVGNKLGEKEILLVSRDISKLKKVEAELKESEERYCLIADNAYLMFYTMSPYSRKIIYANLTICQTLDYQKEELIGTDAFALIHPEDIGHVMAKFDNIIKNGEASDEYRVRKKDGSYIWFETIGKIISTSVPEVELLFFSRDISERKGAEEKLQKQLDYQQHLMNNMNEHFYTYDLDFKITYINQKVCNDLGYSFDEMIGKSMFDFIHDEDKQKIRVRSLRDLQDGRVSIFEHRVFSKDGKELLLRVKIAPIYENGRIIGGQILAEEISEYRRIEKEILKLAQLHTVGEIAAGIGHEIRNPLTTVRGFLQIMSQNPEFFSHRSYFDIMLEELDRANSIISEFLSLEKNKIVDRKLKNLNSIIYAISPLLQADALLAEKLIELDLKEIP
ncbi:MAG: PAS domain S-box protein, partial [Syntrophomonadaceae bacterium]|nr:PAS domain S-box protein [Syntrophomonadaceae bacterium]